MRSLAAACFLITLTACGGPAPAEAPDATVSDADPTPADAEPAAPEASTDAGIAVDLSRSKIEWVASKVVGSHPITPKDYSGTVQVADGKLSSVSFTVQMASIESDNPKLTKHLKNADFFDVDKYPTATFTSTQIDEGSDAEGYTHTVTGTLQVMDAKKSIRFPANITVGDEITAKTTFDLDRTDFGLTYAGMKDNLIQDRVVMTVDFVAKGS